MPSINLAPGTQYIITARRRRLRLYAISIGIAAVFLLGWFALYMYVRILESSSNSVQANIARVDQKIQELHDDAVRVAFFEKRLAGVSKLIDSHIGWEKIFSDMERLLPPDTVLTSFEAASGNSTISLSGTTQNIDQVALALASLTEDAGHLSVFKRGTVKTIQRQEQKNAEGASVVLYTFTMTLEFNKASLNKAIL